MWELCQDNLLCLFNSNICSMMPGQKKPMMNLPCLQLLQCRYQGPIVIIMGNGNMRTVSTMQASTLTAGPLARRLFLLGGPVRASGPSTPLARRGQRAYVRATRVFVLRWPEVDRTYLSCFLAVGEIPKIPGNGKPMST